MVYTNTDIKNIIMEGSKCGVDAMEQGNDAYLKHMKYCKLCRLPFLIKNIMPNDLEAYLVSQS